MDNIEYDNLSQNDKFRLRMIYLKQFMPRHWVGKFVEANPEYNNYKGIERARNVVSLRTVDWDILVKLEEVYKKNEME